MPDIYQTVIIPTCNHPDLLRRSLAKLLQVDDPPCDWEVLVMDNSEEIYRARDEAVVREIGVPRIRRIEMPPLAGLMAARRRAGPRGGRRMNRVAAALALGLVVLGPARSRF